jgi:hypothetical protein
MPYLVVAALAVAAGTARSQTDVVPSADPAVMRATYDRVLSHLDPGGGILLYLNTTDALERLLAQGEALLELVPEDDEAAAALVPRVRAAMDYLREAGWNDVTAVGLSASPGADGLEQIKAFLGLKDGARERSLWRILGGEPRAMGCHRFLPADAVLVRSANVVPRDAWGMVMEGIARVGGPEAIATVRETLAEVAEESGIDLEAVVRSLGDEVLLSLLLDRNVTMSIPGPSGMLAIPRPGFLIAVATRDDSLHTMLVEQAREMEMPLLEQTVDGHPWLTVQQPLPLPVPLQPTIARTEDFLLIASTPEVMGQAFAAARGENPLREDADFQRLMGALPQELNGMLYVSPRLSQVVAQLQTAAAEAGNPQARVVLEKLFRAAGDRGVGVVRVNAPGGIAVAGRSTIPSGELVMGLAVAPAAIIAAVTLPAAARAREVAQSAHCANQLRRLQAAKGMWAMDYPDRADEAPSLADLAPYLGDDPPVCPQGGAYSLGDVQTPPSCSLHGMAAP